MGSLGIDKNIESVPTFKGCYNTGMPKIWINGAFVDSSEASVSVFDHGLLYGDGCFEGIRIYNGRIFKLKSHLRRMFDSAQSIRLNPGYSIEEIESAVRETVELNKQLNGYIRLVFTRGTGTLGLNPFLCPTPTIFIIANDISLYADELYEQGMPIIVAKRPRVPIECLNPAVKSLNYLNNILAKIEAIDAGVMEALMLNVEGEVAECTGDNIFIVNDGAISTPPLAAGILNGITRDYVISHICPGLGYSVKERSVSLDDLKAADEVFLTGTAAEIIGVNAIDGAVIGDGNVGKITRALAEDFRSRVATDAPED